MIPAAITSVMLAQKGSVLVSHIRVISHLPASFFPEKLRPGSLHRPNKPGTTNLVSVSSIVLRDAWARIVLQEMTLSVLQVLP